MRRLARGRRTLGSDDDSLIGGDSHPLRLRRPAESSLDVGLFARGSSKGDDPLGVLEELKQLRRQGSFEAANVLLANATAASAHWPAHLNHRLSIERAWLLYLTGELEEARDQAAKVVETVRNSPYVRELGLSQFALGAALMALGSLSAAIKSFSVALHVFDWQLNDKREAFRALNFIAVAYKRMGKYALAEEMLSLALGIASALADEILTVSAQINLAVVQLKCGRIEKVRASLDPILSGKVVTPDPQRMRASLVMAQVELAAHDTSSVERWLADALAVIRKNPTSREAILYREYAADAKALSGNAPEAIRLLDRALVKANCRFPSSDLICEIQRRRASVLVTLDRLEDAELAAREAVLVSAQVGEPYEIALACRSAGTVAAARGQMERGIDLLRSAESQLDELGELPERSVTAFQVASLLQLIGNYDDAMCSRHEAIRGFRSMGFHYWLERCDGLINDREFTAGKTKSPFASATESPMTLAPFGIITEDSRIIEAFGALRQVAQSKLPVLIEGESGTGKELFAKALHLLSPRASETFLPLNCGAISPDMQEAEFFGHARGSFTGAISERAGYFESANHGTLFLDEIGEMNLSTQTKLLRVLETGELCRVGDTRVRRVDVRYVAATNQELDACVDRREFRLDLLQRLNGLRVGIPPLRERRGDIPRLIHHFLVQSRTTTDLEPKISPSMLSRLVAYDWPGNVRELRLAVERAIILAGTSGQLTEAHFPFLTRDSSGVNQGTLNTDLNEIERVRILEALEKARWSKSVAARLLGLSRTTFNSKMQRLGIPLEVPDRFRSPAR